MPKENNNASKRRGRRQCSKADKEIASKTREALKSVIGSNRYSSFSKEVARKDSREPKQNMIMPSIEGLQSSSSGIIENGIKYMMFPLHLLRFCIFGTSVSGSSDNSKVYTEPRCVESTDRGYEKKNEEQKVRKERKEETAEKKISSDTSTTKNASSKSASHYLDGNRNVSHRSKNPNEDKSDDEDSNDEMVTAEEDSDSSVEQWSSARSMMLTNVSVDHDNFDSSAFYNLSEEPMDISIEEQTSDKTQSVTKISQDSCRSDDVQNNVNVNVSSRSYVENQDSYSSVDEEISRIFQKQCTSSENEDSLSSFPRSYSSCKYEKAKQNNFFSSRVTDKYCPAIPRSKKGLQDAERERKKKTPTEFVGSTKRRKVTDEEIKQERKGERTGKNKVREEKRSSRQDTPSKYKSRSSKTVTKSKESKRENIKYKDTATQTDSAFSDDDVEMVPVDTQMCEKTLCCKSAAYKYQLHPFQAKEMEQLRYMADNEDSNDGFLRIAHKRISLCSTSSSSTDLGFDERASTTPDTDIAVTQCIRAPPGFPEIPQNPPLTSYVYDESDHFISTSSKINNNLNCSLMKAGVAVPPAPSPMRHLYYDYPEFMDLPYYINSSRILDNILKNNYNR